jgi:hypothetical protein
MTTTTDAKQKMLVQAFYRAALFMKARCENDGWQPSSNYLREQVRCATGLKFSNSYFPVILREVLRAHPKLERFIGLKPLKAKHITLPPCGRNLGMCEGEVINGALRCIQCGCVAPTR